MPIVIYWQRHPKDKRRMIDAQWSAGTKTREAGEIGYAPGGIIFLSWARLKPLALDGEVFQAMRYYPVNLDTFSRQMLD